MKVISIQKQHTIQELIRVSDGFKWEYCAAKHLFETSDPNVANVADKQS